MTKKNNSFLFAVVFVAIILLSVSVTAALTNGFSNADPFGWLEDFKSGDVNASGGDLSSGVTDEDGENLESGVLQSMPSQLNFSSQAFAMAQESGASYIEVMLQATVLPEDATNKAVDWSVAWADGSDNSDLFEYLTVTPESDGSNIVSVKCFKPFDKDINIKVTTRDGCFTATCVAKYVGEVSIIGFTTEAPKKDGDYQLTKGQSYEFVITGYDGFNNALDVDLSLNVVSDSTIGSCWVANLVNTRSGSTYWDLDGLKLVSMEDFISDCFSVSVKGNVVTVVVKQSIEYRCSKSYINEQQAFIYEGRPIVSLSESADLAVTEYIDDNKSFFALGYFYLKINDTKSGLSLSIPFVTVEYAVPVSDVSLGQDSITF